jgi:hypothetical protein
MTVYLVDLESVETRYTKQWKTHFPALLKQNGLDVVVIEGPTDIPAATSPGAFLNFGGTNLYKSAQLQTISRLFCDNAVKDGDYFLYADAWNPTVIQLKYMAELLGVKIKIGGMWHAGSYDPQDFLGRIIGDATWVRNAEMSMYECYDDNFFATDFHIELFTETFWNDSRDIDRQLLHKIRKVGWPMEYIADQLAPYKGMKKENIVLFPHRMAPEKQPEIFDYLKSQMPQYQFIKCQELNLSKHEYHELLGKAKIVFSANLQETLGISMYEGLLLDAIPMMPDRLSYTEMWGEHFMYPSRWTANLESAHRYSRELCFHISELIENYDNWHDEIKYEKMSVQKFFEAEELVNIIHARTKG